MKWKILLFLLAGAVAAAGAAFPVHASETEFNVGSESESLGEFGTDDSSLNDAIQDIFDSVEDAGMDFVSPVPSPSESPSESPDLSDQIVDEDPVLEVTPSPTPFIDFDDDDSFIDPLASYNTYYGGISSTYLEFMRGFLPKLGFREHYVASRTSQYNYIFAFGEDLSFNGSNFVGKNVTVVTWNTYNNGSYTYGTESSFSLHPGSYLVYSDLSSVYPSLADSAGFTLRQILILMTAFILGLVIDHMYQVRKIRRIK